MCHPPLLLWLLWTFSATSTPLSSISSSFYPLFLLNRPYVSTYLIIFAHFFIPFRLCLHVYPFTPPTPPPLLHFIRHINSGVCGDKCATVSLSPALVLLIEVYSPRRSSVGGQTGIHYPVVCVCACTPEMSQCFYLCERAMDRGRNTWVRGAVVCVRVTSHAPTVLCMDPVPVCACLLAH